MSASSQIAPRPSAVSVSRRHRTWTPAGGCSPAIRTQPPPDGAFIEGRATRDMDRLPIRRDGDHVVVDLSRMIRSDEQPGARAADAVSIA